MEQALATFVAEARELLGKMESVLLACEQSGPEADTVSELFRSAHTIKGSAGLFGLDEIVAFTHVVETSLDRVRSGNVELSRPLVAVLLECADHMGALIERIGGDPAAPVAAPDSRAQGLIAQLAAICKPVAAIQDHGTSVGSPATTVPPTGSGPPRSDTSSDTWHLSLRFNPDVLRNGMEPASFLRYLNTIGQITAVQIVAEALPDPDSMDPESCYLGFELALRSAADKARIESVFDFVRDGSRIRILPPRSRVADYVELLHAQSDGDARLGELLVRCGTLTSRELEEALDTQRGDRSSAPQPLGEVLIKQGVVQAPVVEAALAKQAQQAPKRAAAADSSSLRIEAGKLDQLIELIAQLTVSGSAVDLLAGRAGSNELREAGSRFGRLVEEVRSAALQLRMVPIGTVFSRFQRIVRDLSRELGKEIGLEVSGADTELDKVLIEQINDPLLHLVRNAMDHGIETAEARLARGKASRGTVHLAALRDGGSIVIEVRDDGAGINRAKVLEKARSQGLITSQEDPTESEILNLILQPGFSTAQVVTNLSGRGVGMDVVKRNIEQLRGTLEIESREGLGTTFRIRLPLTLAIIDGFLLRVGGISYVVPLELVEECIELEDTTVSAGYLSLRGKPLPLLPLYEAFGHSGPRARRRGIIVARWGGRRVGLVVDELLGKLQTVIKPLSPLFASLPGLTGSTVLGDDTIALILDVPALLCLAGQINTDELATAKPRMAEPA
jgi:two-component system, chemotaxis family, sensor kinase CheA